MRLSKKRANGCLANIWEDDSGGYVSLRGILIRQFSRKTARILQNAKNSANNVAKCKVWAPTTHTSLIFESITIDNPVKGLLNNFVP